jgi:ribosomal protein S18 acetylase RimI-like enzyme
MIKSNHPKEPIAYLWFIGVNPQLQGKGIGSTFIQEVINECERKKRRVYIWRLPWRRIYRFIKNLDLRFFSRYNFHIHFISYAGCELLSKSAIR